MTKLKTKNLKDCYYLNSLFEYKNLFRETCVYVKYLQFLSKQFIQNKHEQCEVMLTGPS